MNNTSPNSDISVLKWGLKIVPWIAFIVVFSSLIRLGFWQLSRADQKTTLLNQSAAKRIQPAISISQLMEVPEKQYFPVKLQGKWLHNWDFFLDNRFQDGITGYNQFSLFRDYSGKIVFVDRGWQAIDVNRNFHFVPPRDNQIQVLGYVYQPSQYKVVDVPEILERKAIPVPGLDMPKMIATLASKNIHIEAFIVRQTFPEIEDGLVRKWRILGTPPERNLGYAVQWFLMALALALMPVLIHMKKKKQLKDLPET